MSRFLRFRSKTKRRPPTDLSLRYLIHENRKILWCKIMTAGPSRVSLTHARSPFSLAPTTSKRLLRRLMTAEILYEGTAEASIKRSGLIENGEAINGLYIFV